jgi:hypothetical protein
MVLSILERPSSCSTSRIRPYGFSSKLNWGSCRSVSWALFLFVLARPESCCLPQWLKFHAHPSRLVGQFNTEVQVNNTAVPHLTHTCTHVRVPHPYYYLFPSLHFFHLLWQAGCLRLFPSDTFTSNLCLHLLTHQQQMVEFSSPPDYSPHYNCSRHGFSHQRMNANGSDTKWFIFLEQ